MPVTLRDETTPEGKLPQAHLRIKRITVPIEAQDRVTPAQVEAVGKQMVARMLGEIERTQTLLMLGYRPAEEEPERLVALLTAREHE